MNKKPIFEITKLCLTITVILFTFSNLVLAQEKGSMESKTEQMEKIEKTEQEKDKNPLVLLETSLGNITIELFSKEAPLSVKNFLDYVNDKFYEGTIFHRVVSGFVIQGGGFTPEMTQKPTKPPVKNEAGNKLSNIKGTLAMARTNIVDSATSQFFINLRDNLFLNHKDESMSGFGYCVFGKVNEGMEVVEKIGQVMTGSKGPHQDVPITPVVIKSARVIKGQAK